MEAVEESRPKPVEFAIYLLSAALLIGLLRAVFGADLSAIPVDPLLFYGLLFGAYALMGSLLHKIWSGRNWARFIYTLMFLLGSFKAVAALWAAIDTSLVAGSVTAALLGVQLVAVVLLFVSSSNAWFRQARL